MNATRPRPELLLPAGSPEKLRYAVAYGADAVYLGLPMASLRTPNRGGQFSRDNLAEHVHYAQSRGVKAYVTINIFANNRDLDRVVPHLEQLEAIRPDAIIFSDPGVFRLAKKHAPSVPLHLSTQANTLNAEACAFWQDLGVSRVILAREVPYREIVEIHERLPDLELETFVHGSLCVAYSGRCVISDYLTDNTKNSNKGMCGNSCRWEFNEVGEKVGGCSEHTESAPPAPVLASESELLTLQMSEATRPHDVYTFEEDDKGSYMLNSKDLCLVGHLRELQDAGVVSFKVEGRTKSVYYVATAGRIYNEAIDFYQQHETADDAQIARWTSELSAAGNRGFTEGFFNGRPTRTGINYQDSRSHQTTQFLATVDSLENHSAVANGVRFVARNQFKIGDALDWVTPQGSVPFELKALFDASGLPIDTVNPNQTAIMVPPAGVSPDAQEWSILRSQERAYAGTA